MKKIKIIFFSLLCLSVLIACEDNDEKFSGSPVGVMPIETITATVSSNTTFALPGQEIDFTATLPASFRQVVTDTVSVQATILTMGGSVRNASVDILPGQDSATGKITVAGGGGTFDLAFDLKLTAINLKKVVPGKHYLLNSNVVNIASGNSSVPTTNDQRLKIAVDWENVTALNKLRVKIERVKLTTVTLRGSQGAANIKIGTSTYAATFATDLTQTAANFVTLYGQTIQTVNNILVVAVGSDLQFTYYTAVPPVITVTTVPPNTPTSLKGSIFSEVNVGQANDVPKNFFLSASKAGETAEGSTYAYTPGNYKLKIGVNSASDLAVSPVDLKYRIVVKFPDGHVNIYNGTLVGLNGASGFKDVLTFTKHDLGANATYDNFLFTP